MFLMFFILYFASIFSPLMFSTKPLSNLKDTGKRGMKYRLNNQIVLISGGSQGLGREFAIKYFHESNSKIIILSRSVERLQNTCKEIAEEVNNLDDTFDSNKRLFYYPCDASSYKSVLSLFIKLEERKLIPTQVFMCAGGSIPKLFVDLTPEELENGINMNYNATLYLSHISLKYGVSHLIMISSEVALYPFIGYSQYAPLKQSLRSLASILRQEHQDKRISCIYPGNFLSEGYDKEHQTKPEITKLLEGPSSPISSERCCNRITRWLKHGYDDVTTDLIGWYLMSCDMGVGKHSRLQPLWFIAWIIGTISNLLIVPVYMLYCEQEIGRWFRKQKETE